MNNFIIYQIHGGHGHEQLLSSSGGFWLGLRGVGTEGALSPLQSWKIKQFPYISDAFKNNERFLVTGHQDSHSLLKIIFQLIPWYL